MDGRAAGAVTRLLASAGGEGRRAAERAAGRGEPAGEAVGVAAFNGRGYPNFVHEDAIGRTTQTVAPRDTGSLDSTYVHGHGTRTYTHYNLMDRVDSTVTVGDSVFVGATSRAHKGMQITVYNSYDALGRTTLVGRMFRADPRTNSGYTSLENTWTFDDANRVTGTSSPEGGSTIFYKDKAGNDTAITTPRSHTIQQKFDALGRLVRRAVPSVSFSTQTAWQGYGYFSFPTTDSDDGLCLGADTAYYKYDATGSLRAAENGWAWVHRGYTPAGAVKADTQFVRTYATNAPNACDGGDRHPGGLVLADFTAAHVYSIAYACDLEGRRVSLTHPSQLAPCDTGVCKTFYKYSTARGTLDTVVGPWVGSSTPSTRFTCDNEGRLTQVNHPGGGASGFSHDTLGQLTYRSTPAGTSIQNSYDAMGRLLYSSFEPPRGHRRLRSLSDGPGGSG